MNILEFYIKKNKNIKILLTGINLKSLKNIAEILSKDLSLPVIDISKFIEKDYFKIDSNLNLENLNNIVKENKSFIIFGFLNPLNLKIDFHFNIKYNSDIFKENKLENSKEIYDSYKKNIKKIVVNKFIKYENDDEKIVNNIFDSLMNLISKNIYNENKGIFKKETKKDNPELNNEKVPYTKQKNLQDIYENKKEKKPFKWDKENQYTDLEKYNEDMHNIKIYHNIDDDIYKQMDDSSYSPDEKIFFVQDSFFKNYSGGGRRPKNYSVGTRYINK